MSVILIRHGMTAGNREGRYIGCRTDEPLSPTGAEALKTRVYPAASRLYVSPLRRCLETARLIYPDLTPVEIADFRECDFGAFEGKNYAELQSDPRYQAWIDSGGALPFPDGESRADFARRCVRAFSALPDLWRQDTALIAHGGTLMAIMAAYALPRREYFDYQVKNGNGFILEQDGRWEEIRAFA